MPTIRVDGVEYSVAEGRTILKQLLDEWRALNGALNNIV